MAQNLNCNPLWVDTQGEVIFSHPVRVKAIFWVNDNAGGKDIADNDDMKLLDKAGGNVVFSKRAEANGDGIEMVFGERGVMLAGIYVHELDGGVCLIYV